MMDIPRVVRVPSPDEEPMELADEPTLLNEQEFLATPSVTTPTSVTVQYSSPNVNHPSHYNQGGIETIDVIEAWDLGFCLGNAVKYISRAGKKDPTKTIEDLEKARWFLDHEIAKLKKKNGI